MFLEITKSPHVNETLTMEGLQVENEYSVFGPTATLATIQVSER